MNSVEAYERSTICFAPLCPVLAASCLRYAGLYHIGLLGRPRPQHRPHVLTGNEVSVLPSDFAMQNSITSVSWAVPALHTALIVVTGNELSVLPSDEDVSQHQITVAGCLGVVAATPREAVHSDAMRHA